MNLRDPSTKAVARRRLLILHNPFSGRDRARHLRAVVEALEHGGVRVDIEAPEAFEAIAAAARAARAGGAYDAIVAAGGDGTIRMVAGALAGGDLPLGVVPLGTGNVLAHELSLPRNAGSIARMLMHGPAATVSCGIANGAPFLLMASAGFDAAVLARLDHDLKRTAGQLSYCGPVLRTLTERPHNFKAVIDGVRQSCTWLIVANARRYAGRFVLAPGRSISSPGFDAVIVRTATRLRLLRVLLSIAAGRITASPDAQILPCREVLVPAGQGVQFQIDGDSNAADALNVTARKIPLELILPAPD